MKHIFSIVVIYIVVFLNSYGQFKSPSFEISLSSLTSFGDVAPFWLTSNQQGKYSTYNYAGILGVGLYTPTDTGKKFDYSYGVDLYNRIDIDYNTWLHQAYAEFRLYDLLQFKVGMYEEVIGNHDPSLSSGSIIWSGNARPLPKITIGTPGYVPVPFTKGYIEISGLLSHGWFENSRYVKNVFLHHKNFYLRLGGDFPVNIHYGYNHFAQWGGVHPDHGKLPVDWDSYHRVFFAKSGDETRDDTPGTWVINRFGNHIGSRNYGLDLKLDNLTSGIYIQDIFEDNSGKVRRNFGDGLWGAYLRFEEANKFVSGIVYEYLQTTHQSGPVHNIGDSVIGGNDNYFNHHTYRSGWTYNKMIIGTPLITSPVYNEPKNIRILNNRVIAHHIGLEGLLTDNFRYRLFFTYSRNYGLHLLRFSETRKQYSWMLDLTTKLHWYNLETGIKLAVDIGDMYGNNAGILFTIRKRGNIF